MLSVAGGAFWIDQVTRGAAVERLVAGSAHLGFLHLRLVANRGIFMGMIALPSWVLAVVTLAVVAAVARAGPRGTPFEQVAYGLLAGGALGNLLDRYLTRAWFPPRAVVDWLSFGGTILNLADVFVFAAVLILLIRPGVSEPDPVGERERTPIR